MMTQFISPADSIYLNINVGPISELKHWLYSVALSQTRVNPAPVPAFVLGLKGTAHLRIQGLHVH